MAAVTKLRVGLAQINSVVGALHGNATKILGFYEQSVLAGCDLVAFPELSITGYPPEDLVLKEGFVTDNLAVLARVVKEIRDTVAVVGFVDRDDATGEIFNAPAICRNGVCLACIANSYYLTTTYSTSKDISRLALIIRYL